MKSEKMNNEIETKSPAELVDNARFANMKDYPKIGDKNAIDAALDAFERLTLKTEDK